jgi:hypothetical protein
VNCFVRCPEWLRLYRQCERHQVQWRCNVWCDDAGARTWLSETRSARNCIRAEIRKEVRRMTYSNLTVGPGAARLLASSPRRSGQKRRAPVAVASMVHEHGSLITNATELEAVRILVTHFRNVFFCFCLCNAASSRCPPLASCSPKSRIDEH